MNKTLLTLLLTAILVGGPAVATETPSSSPVIGDPLRFVAIDNVCAWPMLTVLRDGTIIAVIHGRPSHGQMEGDIECWASKEGEFWERRGRPAPNDPGTARLNVAVGQTPSGELIVLCSGWSDIKQPERPKQRPFRDTIIPMSISRSRDGGFTWTQTGGFPAAEAGWSNYIPFGPIIAGIDGALHVACYAGQLKDPANSFVLGKYQAWHFRSDDDGKTWRRISLIGGRHNETALFHVGGQEWLAAARTDAMELFRSEDDGKSWQAPLRVSKRNQIPGHLLRLQDGRILLSYGTRIRDEYGVLGKISADDGRTWSEAFRISSRTDWDGGYPSSVQRSDGRIVTAHYSKASENHSRYHMGVTLWTPPAP